MGVGLVGDQLSCVLDHQSFESATEPRYVGIASGIKKRARITSGTQRKMRPYPARYRSRFCNQSPPCYNFSSAKVAELADAPDLGSGTERCGGSSPPFRTKAEVRGERLEVSKEHLFEETF